MIVIHKFALDVGENKVFLASTSRILHVGEQRGNLFLWAIVDTDAEVKTPRRVYVHGTGFPLVGNTYTQHIGSVQTETGLVWHVFE